MSSQSPKDKEEKLFQITSIIALRKTEFFNRMWAKLKPKVPPEIEHKVRQELLQVISNMPNTTFLSDGEKSTKTIDPKLDIAQLRLDERSVSKEFYKTLRRMK